MVKTRFNGFDIICSLAEIQKLIGYRVNQIYDLDNKTYLIKFHHNEERSTLLFESGVRIHLTSYDWPKSLSPSGFTMKLRKHLKNKRLEAINQLGVDRIVQMQFGTGVASYFVIIELFDRGNIILCDYQLTILNVLRPHSEGEELRFAVKEIYPTNRARQDEGAPSYNALKEKIKQAQPGDTIRTILVPILPCGASLIDHVLLLHDLYNCKIPGEIKSDDGDGKKKKKKGKKADANLRDFDFDKDLTTLVNAINDIYKIIEEAKGEKSAGYIVQRKEHKPKFDGGEEIFYTNIEFHPFLYKQFENEPIKEFPTFLQAVDEFFSSLESQKIDLKALAQEKDALKKLSNIREDHAKRLSELTKNQMIDRQKAELIIRNQFLVESSIHAIQSLLAKQLSWDEIEAFLKERQENNDKLAMVIKKCKFYNNEITLHLTDPYTAAEDEELNIEDLEEDEQMRSDDKLQPMDVDVDLSLTAYANATRYYEMKRSAAKKEQKTIEASGKALKSAEKKTHQTLKDVSIQATITKARKNYWFEKFFWFISSENYLIICGRDQQQNELLVKRYLKANDIYVHAEIQGASSVIIKNPTGNEVPPKTLNEAGTAAACYSVAWDAKVVTSTYWVHANQVSKTAPTGEYLTTGSFMIRGKKNFLPPCHLILGLGFLFKLEDSSVERHKGERKIRKLDDDAESVSVMTEEDREIQLDDSDSDDEEKLSKEVENKLEIIEEEGGAQSEFPDTEIKFEHATGKIDIVNDPKVEKKIATEENQEETIIHGAPIRVKRTEVKMKPQKKGKQQPQQQQPKEAKKDDKSGPKRGQKGKMKKIKEKYKDQDEEDRAMIMQLLQSSGSKSNQKDEENEEKSDEIHKKSAPRNQQVKEKNVEEIDEAFANDEVDMLDTLTGIPVEEDELLFAIPIVAPYQTLTNYKFKVKLTPGTGRRGKASKAALQMFLRDKSTTTREKDLMKAIKEDILARNMPGKVKISAPQLTKLKK